MRVRAKFTVNEITQHIHGYRIKLGAVTDGSPENDMFFKYTPSAEISLSTVNVAAAQAFEVGKEYYVDFTLAESDEDGIQ